MALEQDDLELIQKMVSESVKAHADNIANGLTELVDGHIKQRLQGVEEFLKTASEQQGQQQAGQGDVGNQLMLTLANALVNRLMGPAPSAAPDFTGQFNQLASVLQTVRTVFLDPQIENMQMGMDIAGKAFGYAVRATGTSPDPEAFSEMIRGNGNGNGTSSNGHQDLSLSAEIKRLASL